MKISMNNYSPCPVSKHRAPQTGNVTLADGFRVGILPGLLLASTLLLAVPAASHAAQSLYTGALPAPTAEANDPGTVYNLGIRFTTDIAGSVTHVRAFSTASESGTHNWAIWENTGGTQLASGTWTYGGDNAWISLDIPDVAISPGTEYTVSVSTSPGVNWYPYRNFVHDNAGGNGQNLFYPAGAGRYTSANATDLPATQNFRNNSNYRDIIFEPVPEPSSLVLLTAGAVLLTSRRRRRR